VKGRRQVVGLGKATRPPENEQRETHNRKLQQLMQKPLELLQYRFLPHFAYAASNGATAVDSLRTLFS
jgi:hypothetical protein